MSCSVMAIPYALAWIVGTFVSAVVETVQESKAADVAEIAVFSNKTCDDVHVISESNFLEKKLETPFMDKNILLKTLEEHGIQDLEEEEGKIKGKTDSYSLVFEKMAEDKPYSLTISYLEGNNLEEKLNDLNSEYTMNVQEESYLSIVEKLKENNMQIEEEEVLDDNTIVLTVNLEN